MLKFGLVWFVEMFYPLPLHFYKVTTLSLRLSLGLFTNNWFGLKKVHVFLTTLFILEKKKKKNTVKVSQWLKKLWSPQRWLKDVPVVAKVTHLWWLKWSYVVCQAVALVLSSTQPHQDCFACLVCFGAQVLLIWFNFLGFLCCCHQ